MRGSRARLTGARSPVRSGSSEIDGRSLGLAGDHTLTPAEQPVSGHDGARLASALGIILKFLYALGALATLALGATFTRAQRDRFPLLRRLDGRQAHLFLIAAGCVLVALPLDILADKLKVKEEQQSATEALRKLRKALGDGSFPQTATGTIVTIQADRLSAAVSLAIRSEESYQKHEYNEALLYLREADALAGLAPIKARIADCFFNSGDYLKAIAYEQQAIALAPDWSGPYYIAGLSYLRLGRIDDAREALTASCRLGFAAACDVVP